MIFLEQSFTLCMPFLMATTAFALGTDAGVSTMMLSTPLYPHTTMMFQIVDYTINIDTDNLLSLFVLTISDTSTIL